MNLSFLRRTALTGALLIGATGTRAQAAVLTVTNLNDAGAGSLRQAIADANANTQPTTDVITFASGLSGTLTLTSGELVITNSVIVQGPTEQSIVLSGGNASRIFSIRAAQANVWMSHLILTQGAVVGVDGATGTKGAKGGAGGSAQGGAIFNQGQLRVEEIISMGNSLRGGKGGTGGAGAGGAFSLVAGDGGTGGTGGSAQGSAIYNSGSLQITNSTFYGNSTIGGQGGTGGLCGFAPSAGAGNFGRGGEGGSTQGNAVYSSGPVAISNSTFYNNSAWGGRGGDGPLQPQVTPLSGFPSGGGDGGNGGAAQGGAIYSGTGLSMTNATLYGNSAIAGSGGVSGRFLNKPTGQNGSSGSSSGGAIYSGKGLNADSCTLCSNRATVGAALTSIVGAQVNNSLFVDHSNNDVSGSLMGAYNLIGLTVAQAGLQTDGAGTPVLQDNGGFTPTIGLIAGSPAIDAGSTSLPTDQRGFPRPVGKAADIGAFEGIQTSPPKPTATPIPTATPRPTPTTIPKPTATPSPTATPRPTATPKPTATPQPTATPKPTATPLSNHAPVITSVTLTPQSPQVGALLTANVGAADADGDALTYTYTWTRARGGKNTLVRTTTTTSTSDTLDTKGGLTLSGDVITVSVVASDGKATSAPRSAQVIFAGTPVSVVNVTLTPGSPRTRDVLLASVQVQDADGTVPRLTYVWSKTSAGVTTTLVTTTSTQTQTSLDLSKTGYGNKGDTITLTVTASNSVSTSSKSASVTVVNTVPVLTNLKLAPSSPQVTGEVTATFVVSDPDASDGVDTLTYLYIWKANGRTLSLENGATVDLSRYPFLKAGDVISLEMRVSDGTSFSATQTASVTTASTPFAINSAGNS